MKITYPTTLVAGALAAALALPALAQDTALETDQDKISYSLGLMIGERVLKQYEELDYELLIEAMKAQHAGEETAMTMEEAGMTLQAQQEAAAAEASAAAAEASDAYLSENAAQEGVQVTDSGLQYEMLEEGDGPKPSLDDTVSVHYVGTLIDGTEFDSSVARGEPATFPLKGVIPGWTEGLQLMNVGSKYRFAIPADLAYGENAPPGSAIGPNETLLFEVELLEILEG